MKKSDFIEQKLKTRINLLITAYLASDMSLKELREAIGKSISQALAKQREEQKGLIDKAFSLGMQVARPTTRLMTVKTGASGVSSFEMATVPANSSAPAAM